MQKDRYLSLTLATLKDQFANFSFISKREPEPNSQGKHNTKQQQRHFRGKARNMKSYDACLQNVSNHILHCLFFIPLIQDVHKYQGTILIYDTCSRISTFIPLQQNIFQVNPNQTLKHNCLFLHLMVKFHSQRSSLDSHFIPIYIIGQITSLNIVCLLLKKFFISVHVTSL